MYYGSHVFLHVLRYNCHRSLPSLSLSLSLSLQTKCHQYWPEVGSMNMGDITITLIEVQDLAYYTIRTFRVTRVSYDDRPYGCFLTTQLEAVRPSVI